MKQSRVVFSDGVFPLKEGQDGLWFHLGRFFGFDMGFEGGSPSIIEVGQRLAHMSRFGGALGPASESLEFGDEVCQPACSLFSVHHVSFPGWLDFVTGCP
jgi:hypothetical protein